MKILQTTGIYMITNHKTGKQYIGQSKTIEKRWNTHKSNRALIKNKNKALYIDFVKYGIENFSFKIIKKCNSKDLNRFEKYYIKKYNTKVDGYNATSGGAAKTTKKTKKKQPRAYVKGDISETIYKGKRIICINDDRLFLSISSAAKYYNVDNGNIVKILKGIRSHSKGFSFKYL